MSKWNQVNKLNSKLQCYCSNHKTARPTFNLRIQLYDDPKKRVKAANFFIVVHINHHYSLSWSKHIDHIAKKIFSVPALNMLDLLFQQNF